MAVEVGRSLSYMGGVWRAFLSIMKKPLLHRRGRRKGAVGGYLHNLQEESTGMEHSNPNQSDIKGT